jgi:hypothetical protein
MNSLSNIKGGTETSGAKTYGLVLDDAIAAFNPTERAKGKTIIRVCP